MACGCPSIQIQDFTSSTPCSAANQPASVESANSALSHWPVQIRLVPPDAPFLKGADLLVAADCVPVAFPTLHNDFLKGRAVMIGCPKFDDKEGYIEKFKQVFAAAGLKSITCVVMEVPCCAGLPSILVKTLEESGKNIPLEVVVIRNFAGYHYSPKFIVVTDLIHLGLVFMFLITGLTCIILKKNWMRCRAGSGWDLMGKFEKLFKGRFEIVVIGLKMDGKPFRSSID